MFGQMKKQCIVLLLAWIFCLAGCGEKTGEKTATEVAKDTRTADTLVIAVTKDENTLSPFTYVSGTGLVVNRLIYDTLLTTNLDGDVVPWMVEDDYDVSPDNKVFKLTLKEGLKFHNGEPVTAEDVKFSFEYPADKKVAALRKISKKIASIQVPDPRTIIFNLKESDLSFERDGLAYMRIISKSVYKDEKKPENIALSIGSGMYRLVEYKVGKYYKLEAVGDYFRGPPKVKSINMPIVKDATAVQQGLLSGQFAAATSDINAEAVEVFKRKPGLAVYAGAGYAPLMLNFNNGGPSLSKKEVRQAMAYGIDMKSISKSLYGEYAKLGSRGLIRSDHEYSQGGLDYTYDKEKSSDLLRSAGYLNKNEEGYLIDAQGKELAFELLTYAGNAIRSRMAELVAANLKEVGVRVLVKSMEMDTVDAYVWPDFEVSKGRNYDMAAWGWSNTNTPTFLLSLCSSEFDIGTYNVMGYKSEAFDAVVREQYAQAIDMQKMSLMLQNLQNIVAEDVPALVIAYPDSLQVGNTDQYDGWKKGKGLNMINVFSFL